MSHPHDHEAPIIHRKALIAIGLLMALTIVFSAWSSWTGNGTVEMPYSAVVEEREFVFSDRADGAVIVHEDGRQVAVIPSGDGNFVRGVLRALARTRQLGNDGPEAPYRLLRRADGRLTLIDPVTDERVEITAFGPDNVAAFADLLRMGRAKEAQATSHDPLRDRQETEA